MSDGSAASSPSRRKDYRYSLREMMENVKVERRDSQFARQLVDATEIDKIFQEARLKKKKKKGK